MNQYYILVMILYILEDVRYRYGDMTLVLSVPGHRNVILSPGQHEGLLASDGTREGRERII